MRCSSRAAQTPTSPVAAPTVVPSTCTSPPPTPNHAPFRRPRRCPRANATQLDVGSSSVVPRKVPMPPPSMRNWRIGTRYDAEPTAMPVDRPSATRVAAPLAVRETRSLQRLHSPATFRPSVSAKSSVVRRMAPTSKVVCRAHCAFAVPATPRLARTANVRTEPSVARVCCSCPEKVQSGRLLPPVA